MTARRTFAHEPTGWSAVALAVEPAESGKEGFYLTLFPEGKPQVLFLRAHQLTQLCEMAASSQVNDHQLWDAVARIPLEPLMPNRVLAAKLRVLLIEQAAPIQDAIRQQIDRRPPPTPEPEQTNPVEPPPSFPKAF